MAFVNAVCPSCGANIQLDASVDNGFCSYCGTRISVREAVNKANSEPKSKPVVDSKNTNEVLKANARKSYEVGQYGNAITDWQRAISVDRTDYEAYWGLVLTQMRYKNNYNPETDSDFRAAMSYAPTHKKLEYERYIKEWKRSETQRINTWYEQELVTEKEEQLSRPRGRKFGIIVMACGILFTAIGVLDNWQFAALNPVYLLIVGIAVSVAWGIYFIRYPMQHTPKFRRIIGKILVFIGWVFYCGWMAAGSLIHYGFKDGGNIAFLVVVLVLWGVGALCLRPPRES
jgi:DNA-directed RNA polymerase subunit RPC12/RpoP